MNVVSNITFIATVAGTTGSLIFICLRSCTWPMWFVCQYVTGNSPFLAGIESSMILFTTHFIDVYNIFHNRSSLDSHFSIIKITIFFFFYNNALFTKNKCTR